MKKFALIGAAGFIAKSHFEAILSNQGRLVAACDTHDSVQTMDFYHPDTLFFGRQGPFHDFLATSNMTNDKIDYLVVCTPDDLHVSHIVSGLKSGCHVICEKPLCPLEELTFLHAQEKLYQRRIFTVQQLRYHLAIKALRRKFEPFTGERADVELTYITHRGPWYESSWRGTKRAQGLISDIGIHFLDALLFSFGSCLKVDVREYSSRKASGILEFEKAHVRWFLSLDAKEIQKMDSHASGQEYRRLSVNHAIWDLTKEFRNLHQEVYKAILLEKGIGLAEIEGTLSLCDKISRLGANCQATR